MSDGSVSPNAGQESELSLRDIVRIEFNRMGGFQPVLEEIVEPAKRQALLEELAARFTGIPIRGVEDRHLKGFFSYCRLKLDTLPNPADFEDFFLTTVLTHAGAAPEAAPLVAPLTPSALGMGASAPAALRESRASEKADVFGDSPGDVSAGTPRAPTRRDMVKGADARVAQSIYLFPGGTGIASLPPSYPRYLLPCPDPRDPIARARWISGEVASADGLAIAFSMSGLNDEDAMLEAETEMAGEPEEFLARYGVITAQKEIHLKGHGAVLNDLARRLEPAGRDRTLDAMRDAMAEALRVYRPEMVDDLEKAGARLVVGPKAMRAAALVIAAEEALLSEITPEEEAQKPPQNLLGFPDPGKALRPGTTLAHAMAKHLGTGRQVLDAMVDSLAETRLAQLLRNVDPEEERQLMAGFDAVFLADCLSPTEAYRIAKMDYDLQPAL